MTSIRTGLDPTSEFFDVNLLQRRTVRALVLTQAVGAVGITIGIATASLLARDLSGSESLAGLAQTFQVLGTAVLAFLLAAVMGTRGRRVGLVLGYLIAAAGAAIAVLAGVVGSMVLLLVGAVLLGSGSAANSASRYAATDLATDANRARSLSVVVWATTIGAVLGPNLTGASSWFADAVGIPDLTGPFAFGAIGMLLAAVVVGVLLRPDPLLVAQQLSEAPAVVPARHPFSGLGRALATTRERPVLAAAIVGLALAHAAMVGVMVMTPLHMEHGGVEHGGASLEVIGLVISVHVLGMFAFSPLVGMLADRLGRAPVLGAGGAVLAVALVLCSSAPHGMSWQVTAGLFLLGLGWSLAMVSASTLVAEHAPIEVRTDVQGASDLVMGLTAAAAGLLSGLVVDWWGYPELALITLALAAGVVACALSAATRRTS